ncbi:hypothetical protein THH46_03635 [Pseudomonas sp. NA13]
MIRQKLDEHQVSVDGVFQPDHLAGLDVDELREQIEELQDAWRRTSRLTALATTRERRDLGAVARLQLPYWLRSLGHPDRERLRTFERQASWRRHRSMNWSMAWVRCALSLGSWPGTMSGMNWT